MTGTPSYQFLPWLRRGLAASPSIQLEGGRSKLDVKLDLRVKTVGQDAEQSIPFPPPADGANISPPQVKLYGPGDILGFDASVVAGTDPSPNVGDFEPNLFPAIEFCDPDFPWRFTPGPPTSIPYPRPDTRPPFAGGPFGGKPPGRGLSFPAIRHHSILTPWVCLIALLAEDVAGTDIKKEFVEGQRSDKDPLPWINVTKGTSLPLLSQAWRWAHVQVVLDGLPLKTAGELKNLLQEHPERVLSRLVCARRLRPRVLYRAFVVPTFLRGREAGRGRATTETDGPLQPAWSNDGSNIDLPYYFAWEFRTGFRGDFEYLVRRLQFIEKIEGLGTRTVDGSKPGYQIKMPSEVVIEGALRPITKNAKPGGSDIENLPESSLSSIPNSSGSSQEYRVIPPWYGQLHVLDPKSPPKWVDDLNHRAGYRIAAGLGAKLVRDRQDGLMAEAWQQAKAHRKANVELNRAAFGAALSMSYLKRLQRLPVAALLRLTSPVQGRITLPRTLAEPPITVREYMRSQPRPVLDVHDPAFRRLARPRGALAKGGVTSDLGKIFVRLYDRAPEVASPGIDRRPGGTIGLADLLQKMPPADTATIARPGADELRRRELATNIVARWRDATRGFGQRPVARSQPSRSEVTLDLAPLKRALVVDAGAGAPLLHPGVTIVQRAARRVQGICPTPKPSNKRRTLDPSFPQPLYEWLRDLSPDFLLPGLDRIPPNSVILLETNWRFVKAFLCGANHEMASELRWRGYPATQRPAGTYFTRFWPASGTSPAPDVAPISTWSSLEDNKEVGNEPRQELVLLFRGDLLNKYPGAALYIQIDQAFHFPTFQAPVPPDITVVGFDLELNGAQDVNLIIEQPVGKCRFGMDEDDQGPLSRREDLSWEHFPSVQSDSYVNNIQPPSSGAVRWDTSSAIASATLQNPVQVVRKLRFSERTKQ